MQKTKPTIRQIESGDIPQIVKAFKKLGWNKPASQYENYLLEQKLDRRNVYVAFVEDYDLPGISPFAGYPPMNHSTPHAFQKSWISMFYQSSGVRASVRH